MILLDPVTREPLGELPGEAEWRRKQAERGLMAAHWRPGWRSGIDWEDGIPVRMWFRQCFEECCKDVER